MDTEASLIPLLTPEETGKEFNVTGRTILNWEAEGIISPAVRVGKTVRFDLAIVKTQLAAATEQAVREKQAKRNAASSPSDTAAKEDRHQ
jgi:hypothetical protein